MALLIAQSLKIYLKLIFNHHKQQAKATHEIYIPWSDEPKEVETVLRMKGVS